MKLTYLQSNQVNDILDQEDWVDNLTQFIIINGLIMNQTQRLGDLWNICFASLQKERKGTKNGPKEIKTEFKFT